MNTLKYLVIATKAGWIVQNQNTHHVVSIHTTEYEALKVAHVLNS